MRGFTDYARTVCLAALSAPIGMGVLLGVYTGVWHAAFLFAWLGVALAGYVHFVHRGYREETRR